MKILKCYIENFGKLSNQEFNFNDGLNTIVEENGYGKTTLATFIKAMFYGLPSTTKKNLDDNERKKYNPWQGGNFGGYIEFQVGEEQYKVERFFGKKEAEDVFNIIDLKTGKKTNKYSTNLGEELFGLDADSYERSTFIPQKEIEGGISDKISSKLINMVQGSLNKDSYENAINLIKERTTELKKRGNTGKIAEVEAEIAEISEEIDGLKKSADTLDQFQNSLMEEDSLINSLEAEKKKISSRINEYGKLQEVKANSKYIEEKNNEKLKIEENIKECESILNGNDVSLEILNEFSLKNDELVKLKAKEKALIENSVNEEKVKELNTLFSGKNITSQEIENIIKKEEQAREIKSEIDFIKKSQEQKASVGKSKNTKIYLPLICVIIFVCVGLLTLKNLIVSLIMFGLATISLITSVIIFVKNRSASKQEKESEQNIDLLEKENKYNQILEEINNFVSQFEMLENVNLVSFLYELLSKNKEFNILNSEILKKSNLITSLEQDINSLEEDIKSFFNLFNIDYGSKSNLEVIEKIKLAIIALNQNKILLTNINKALEEYKNIDFNDSLLHDSDFDINELQKQEKEVQINIDSHRSKKNELLRKIDYIKNAIIDLDEFENQLEEKKNQRAELKNEYSILTLTNKFLSQANDNLTSKYKKPMQDSLNKYLSMLLGKNYQNFNLDTELNVSFEKFGQTRGLEYLSKGYKGVIDLCIRFALVESLFDKEKPFIVLDDPFVNLDKEKLANAIELIKNVSKEYQLIYFVCHDSRA